MLTAGVSTLILAPPLLLVTLFTSSREPSVKTYKLWSWLVTKAMGVSFSLHGADKVQPGTSYIVTPNHQGDADVLALQLTLPVRFLWVLKKELLKIPFFGWALGRGGAIALDRSKRRAALKKLMQESHKLSGGWSLLIYPEGTRSPDGSLLPFKKGAFILAVETGVPILPVTINGAYKILPKKSLDLRPGHMTVTLGDPIPTEGLTGQDVPALIEKTREAVSKSLDPAYDPFDPKHRS